VFVIAALSCCAQAEVLTPPYFNLAEGRRITATATCGEGIDEPELYCKLVGATSDTDDNPNVIHGQVNSTIMTMSSFSCLYLQNSFSIIPLIML
jgi:laminin alpha 3/5